MTDSLRDQLLGLGFKPAPKPERPAQARSTGAPAGKPQGRSQDRPHGRPHGKPGGRPGDRSQSRAGDGPQTPRSGDRPQQRSGDRPQQRPGDRPQQRSGGKPRTREEIDLAKAYALRAQREKDERIAAEAAKQEEARKRREARAQVTELVKDKALNLADADIARHFPYGGKIKRIYVTADQLKALNAGELGVLQLDGRYLLVSAALLAEAEGIFPAAVALKVDPDAPAGDDPYADPMYQVPDDLVW